MKKTFLKTLNVPLSPLLLPPFHTSGEIKNINFHPPPLHQFKKKLKKSTYTLSSPSSHNEYNPSPWPS
jgi:hypothetical protein